MATRRCKNDHEKMPNGHDEIQNDHEKMPNGHKIQNDREKMQNGHDEIQNEMLYAFARLMLKHIIIT